MTHLKKRERAKTNASLISMVQRFSDITIMFGGLWVICELSGLPFLYMHLLVALITLVVFSDARWHNGFLSLLAWCQNDH
ncbi:Colanic acid biosynthsis UDP-glucose lipid carrier transferase WcaJ [Citrobacter freundii]|uniref:Colanic acid biosynthsis UDP-glucose lipid carrier transferase WcaJ n=1 Tax=Citrobacter freundii TaxID=546 RepID=A0A7G2IKS9_CITFR|nr:Colanic acid biosynthsis UDP-glucose lipid carrier transferase WcaJ [Citrobacter freundii]